MSRCFTFKCELPGRETIHVHFVPAGVTDISEIVEEYVEARRGMDAPEKVVFLGFGFAAPLLRQVLTSPELAARKAEIGGNAECAFQLWLFDQRGGLIHDDGMAIASGTAGAIRTAGMMTITHLRGVVVETHPSFHYVKPSKHHVDRFVRAANALVRGAEVVFLAAWLLPYMQHEFRVVHCDTAGIAALAHAAINLKFLFAERAAPIEVSSFGSYAGLQENALDSPAACLVLVSASTSGSMAKLICEESHVPPDFVVTVFYLGPEVPNGHVLCDLTKPRNADGHEPAVNRSEAACKLCANGSIPLRMEGDGFMPEPPKVTLCLVEEKHLPSWLHSFVTASVSSQAVRCAVARAGTDTTDELYLDAFRLVQHATDLRGKWQRILSRGIPADVSRIVYFEDDPASKAFADELKGFLDSRTVKPPAMVGLSRVPVQSGAFSGNGATVVTASAIVKGRRITSVSRDLRDSPGPIVYAAGLSRTESAETHRRIRANLTKSATGVDHVLQVASEIYLPPARADSVSSWARERRLLENWSNRRRLPDVMLQRLDLLLRGGEGALKGYRDRVFLVDLNGAPLRLRKNSIFFPNGFDAATVSQADVFFAVVAVLHKLRGEPAGAGSLGRGLRNHALLAPTNFERYTDGVIQAAFLRAALPIELDYGVDGATSAHMLEFLRSLFRNLEAQGEAALEFAMAIATERLRLSSQDQETLSRQWGEDAGQYSDPLRALVELIRVGR